MGKLIGSRFDIPVNGYKVAGHCPECNIQSVQMKTESDGVFRARYGCGLVMEGHETPTGKQLVKIEDCKGD